MTPIPHNPRHVLPGVAYMFITFTVTFRTPRARVRKGGKRR